MGSVLSIGQIDPQTSLMSLRVAFPNADHNLKIGGYATAEVIVQKFTKAVVVPKQAVVIHDGKSVVYSVDAENIAHVKEVEVGNEDGDLIRLIRGLSGGERVIKLGHYELSDGAKVQQAEAPPREEKP